MDSSNQNLQTAKSWNSGANTSLTSREIPFQTKAIKIGGVINKLRVIQGWNMIGPKDTEPVARIWIEQLDRRDVSPGLYDELLNRAIDYRTGFLQRGENPPSLTVELLIAMFDTYRKEKRAEYNKLFPNDSEWNYYEEIILDRSDLSLPDGSPGKPYPPEQLVQRAQWRYHRSFDSFDEMKAFVQNESDTRPERKRQFWIDAQLPEPQNETVRWANA